MVKLKQRDCRAQTIYISGLNLGILDLENRVAYLPDSDAFMAKVKPLDIWKAGDITLAYASITSRLKKEGFSINYYEPEPIRTTQKSYDILS